MNVHTKKPAVLRVILETQLRWLLAVPYVASFRLGPLHFDHVLRIAVVHVACGKVTRLQKRLESMNINFARHLLPQIVCATIMVVHVVEQPMKYLDGQP